jgi:hypothetical protein
MKYMARVMRAEGTHFLNGRHAEYPVGHAFYLSEKEIAALKTMVEAIDRVEAYEQAPGCHHSHQADEDYMLALMMRSEPEKR